ncbi:aldo/keto reductase [Mucilaginibacter sp. RS28]|uniref:Aldo/keto reductase n=1 Tax=Mucilaginibacter straminoryzae TaxID=2932774 RepID=A0A9X2BAP5_9SPHI|nr:aldo/keto reductase [Mucilaginibacter straminoryzae]MCJ8208997.1 aldo/keto reductase [Mucilaginibacter straminoryzae]
MMELPKVIYGTSGLGNLYTILPDEEKLAIISECIRCTEGATVFDSAGKYGAGLALETLGKCLRQLDVSPEKVMISNKLGWLRTDLDTPEPTFEPGVWRGLKHDAVQRISYKGILDCYAQGNELLDGYVADLVSVHDPDEYINGASDLLDAERRYEDILDAYSALAELKSAGEVKGIGIGAKDWRVVQKISRDVPLDWVMIANSFTIHSHPMELIEFMQELERNKIAIINSAVFNGGFLTGLDFYNYRPVDPVKDSNLYQWRESFYKLCREFEVEPAAACIAFAISAPGVNSIALNTTNKNRVSKNMRMAEVQIPNDFWMTMILKGMIDPSYAFRYLLNNWS